jgi:hypothetical protein
MKWSNCHLGHDAHCTLCKVAVRELAEISEVVKSKLEVQDLDAIKDQLHKILPIWREYNLESEFPDFMRAIDLLKLAESWSDLVKSEVQLCVQILKTSETLIVRGS